MKTIIKRDNVILFEMVKDNKNLSDYELYKLEQFNNEDIDNFTIEFAGNAKVKDINRLDEINLDKIASMTINLRKLL